jgi:hypothetical protein
MIEVIWSVNIYLFEKELCRVSFNRFIKTIFTQIKIVMFTSSHGISARTFLIAPTTHYNTATTATYLSKEKAKRMAIS